MSGGERVALYLLARIIDAPSGIIFIDEPELHFHRVLAKKFWNEVETLRPDCRFVYITHDLPFAISRTDVQFILVYSENDQRVMEQQNQIPDEIVESLLGAATFSVSASEIIFCEGGRKNKRDDELYSSLFGSEDIAVIPVGNCEEVIKCVKVFNNNPIIQGVKATGIIDRDFRSEKYLDNIPEEIKILPVHEIESLFCIKEVFNIVGGKLGKEQKDLDKIYGKVVGDIINHFNKNEADKMRIILERVKQRIKEQSKSLLHPLNDPSKDIGEIKTQFLELLDIENWEFSPRDIFDEEQNSIESILKSKDMEGLLKVFPGKLFFGKIIQGLDTSHTEFINIILSALNNPQSKIDKGLRLTLERYVSKK